jgi:hypothetical protein
MGCLLPVSSPFSTPTFLSSTAVYPPPIEPSSSLFAKIIHFASTALIQSPYCRVPYAKYRVTVFLAMDRTFFDSSAASYRQNPCKTKVRPHLDTVQRFSAPVLSLWPNPFA